MGRRRRRAAGRRRRRRRRPRGGGRAPSYRASRAWAAAAVPPPPPPPPPAAPAHAKRDRRDARTSRGERNSDSRGGAGSVRAGSSRARAAAMARVHASRSRGRSRDQTATGRHSIDGDATPRAGERCARGQADRAERKRACSIVPGARGDPFQLACAVGIDGLLVRIGCRKNELQRAPMVVASPLHLVAMSRRSGAAAGGAATRETRPPTERHFASAKRKADMDRT